MISYLENVWPGSDSFFGHTKSPSVEIVPQVVIQDSCGTWNSQKLRNKLASGRQKIQGQKRNKLSW